MPQGRENQSDHRSGALSRAACPNWCVTGHGSFGGEEDWVHLGEPLRLADGPSARLCMTLDPSAGIEDGPYVVIGAEEYSLLEAQALGASLMAMAAAGAGSTRSPAI